jgi:iron complex transport system permease protein
MRKQAFLRYKWTFLLFLVVALFVINLSIGSVNIPPKEIVRALFGLETDNPIWKNIVLDFRLTKSLTALLAGAALGLGGLQMQTLFRNPLAGPDVLGLSAGASLAVSFVFMAGAKGLSLLPSSWSIAIAACVGSGLVLLIVLAIASKVKDNTSLLIVGLMIGAATASLVSVLQFTSRAEDQQYFLIWTFGSLGGLDFTELSILTLALASGLILSVINIKALNAWQLGDSYALSLGIKPAKARLLMIITASLLAGAVTAFCGPIAFVGLAVPHLIKLWIKTSDHRTLVPAVVLGGAALLLFCDSIAQLPGARFVLPINVITALIGAPVVIWIIIRGRKIYV